MTKFSVYSARYQKYRDDNRLQDGLWKEKSNGVNYACALGALLNVNDNQAEDDLHFRRGCASSMMPRWLVAITPEFFDWSYGEPGFNIKWSDALYLPHGLIDRANQLPTQQRVALYDEAEQEIKRRVSCHFHGIWPMEWLDMADLGSALGLGDEERVAGTIVLVLDELLIKAGV